MPVYDKKKKKKKGKRKSETKQYVKEEKKWRFSYFTELC